MVRCFAHERGWRATIVAGAGHDDLVEVHAHLDPPADRSGMHRVVAGVDPHPVITAQPFGLDRHAGSGSTGGNVIIAARSSTIRSVGRHRNVEWIRLFALRKPLAELRVEVLRRREPPARQEARLQDSRLARSTRPLASGSPGLHTITPIPSVPRNRWNGVGQRSRRPLWRDTSAASLS